MRYILLLIALIASETSFSQNTVVAFRKLPDTLKTIIKRDVSSLLEKDTLSGNLFYTEGEFNIGIDYKFFLKSDKLVGNFSEMASCAECFSMPVRGNTKVVVVYCCKDPSHKPQETAKTKDEMVEIKKTNHCSKIGICIID